MNIEPQHIGMLVGSVTLGGLIWRMSATNTLILASVDMLKNEIAELKAIRAEVQAIPLIGQRVEQLEKFMSSFPKRLQDQQDRDAKIRKSQGGFDE